MFSNQTKFVHCLNVRIWIVARQAFRGWPRERICAGSFHFSATPQTFCAPRFAARICRHETLSQQVFYMFAENAFVNLGKKYVLLTLGDRLWIATYPRLPNRL